MTRRRSLGYFALIIGASACGFIGPVPGEPQDVFLFSTRSVDGEEREYHVSRPVLESTPSWTAVDEEAPISPHQAGKIAASHAKPDAPERIEVISFSLSGVRHSTASELHWYYVVSFYDLDEAYGNDPPETRTLVILMDGSVVEEEAVSPPNKGEQTKPFST